MIDLRFTTQKAPLPLFIHEDILDYAIASNDYHHQPEDLVDLIVQKNKIPSGSVFITGGIDQAIYYCLSLYGQSTHVFTPTYVSYSDARDLGFSYTEHSALEANKLYQISTSSIKDASLIFLANPNNPFGITMREQVLELVRNNPQAIVFVDEAYAGFSDASVINEVANFDNLIVARSFSKDYSLAGFRIGYITAPARVIDKFSGLDSYWFNVAYTSAGAAISALEHENYFTSLRSSILQRKRELETKLKQDGHDVIASNLNASTIKFNNPKDATTFVEKLKSRNILIGQGNGASNIGLDDTFVRIAIGTETQMDKLTIALSR